MICPKCNKRLDYTYVINVISGKICCVVRSYKLQEEEEFYFKCFDCGWEGTKDITYKYSGIPVETLREHMETMAELAYEARKRSWASDLYL